MSPRTLAPLSLNAAATREMYAGLGRARHQSLDELAADEGADVRVVEDVVDRPGRGPARRLSAGSVETRRPDSSAAACRRVVRRARDVARVVG